MSPDKRLSLVDRLEHAGREVEYARAVVRAKREAVEAAKADLLNAVEKARWAIAEERTARRALKGIDD